MPAFFALSLLALPLRESRLLPAAVVVLAATAVISGSLHLNVLSNFAKFGALTTLGWLFLRLFEGLYLAVVIALVIPWIDAYSVWRGPTRSITDHHPAVFSKLSVAFVVPASAPARLGLPDILFFSVFLAASARFGLRRYWTWLGMCSGLGITIALTTYWSTGGLPALPAISLGFLLPNADLIWKQLRTELASRRGAAIAIDRPSDES